MGAYYNESDPKAAAWLRELIRRNLIAPGDVDERSILDVRPDDLRGYRQCHFFAGIGVWSYALRCAGWTDDRPVWTGSCPCQPFSVAGKRKAHADERHLWPAWFALIRECRPVTVFGEQVGGKTGLLWFDHVRADLETCDYAAGLASFGACDVGAPHIRQRLYFVAHASDARQNGTGSERARRIQREPSMGRETRALADVERGTAERYGRELGSAPRGSESEGDQRERIWPDAGDGGDAGIVGDAECQRYAAPRDVAASEQASSAHARQAPRTAGTHFWSDAEWLACRDGKARPAQPGIFPLASGAAARVVRLRGYGNALCAPQAAEFIRACLDLTHAV